MYNPTEVSQFSHVFDQSHCLSVSHWLPCFCLLPKPIFTSYFLAPATLRSSSTAPTHLMWGPVSPTQTASLPLRTCWPTWCYECLSGSWPSLPALATSLLLAWGHLSVLRTPCMLPASKSSAVSNHTLSSPKMRECYAKVEKHLKRCSIWWGRGESHPNK